MNGAHLYLLINHLPVLGTFFGLALLAVAAAKRSDELRQAAFGTFVIAALAAVAAYLTGEPAEDVVKGLPGISRPLISRHEDAAGIALGGSIALGVLALGGLIWFRGGKPINTWLTRLVLAAAILVTALMAWTANLGGQIHHPEIRPNTLPTTTIETDRT